MVFWQRFLITIIVMFVASFLAGLLWRSVFYVSIPGYLAGVIGGITALPVWEFLKRIKPKQKT